MTAPTMLEVKILGKPMRLSCDEAEKDALLNAVALLNDQIQEIRESGKIVGSDRIVTMAALNISNQLLTLRTHGINLDELRGRITSMNKQIDTVLNDQEKLF
jgi:cell division protein ZapA|tara:strand:- start:1501 stop:1806 length:306 start_codon:yes stop_codon:yes gene_type:complete